MTHVTCRAARMPGRPATCPFAQDPACPPSRRPARLLLAAALAAVTALAGCFGGDDDPPATAAATADAATTTWNSDASLDVLANDSVSQGEKRLLALVRAPANGSASLVDGRIVYRPRDGFFGDDTLRYSLGTSAGTATAEAEVAITVEAVLALRGLAIDAPLAQAAVQISGAASAAATTNAQGAWQADVRLRDPQGVVQLTAAGSGAQAHVRLVGAAAAADLAAAAAPDGTVAAERVDSLTVSHFSTALAALAERAHGRVPGTAATLAEARAKVNAEDLLNLATLIHLVADEGLALPAGKADTWALVGDATATAALLAAQATADGNAFEQAQARALGALPAAGLLPTAGMLVAYPAGSNSGAGVAFTLAADGSARVVDRFGTRTAQWTQDAAGLTLSLSTPFSQTGFTGDDDPVTGRQNEMRADVTGYRLKRLPSGLVTLTTAQTETILDGSRAGQVRVLAAIGDPGVAYRLAIDPAAAAPLAAADFETGKRWGGVLVQAFAGNGGWDADMLEITAAGSGRAVRKGITYTVQHSGAAFTLTGSDGSVRDYLRLGDAGAGASYFLVTDRSAAEAFSFVWPIAPPAAASGFDAASASRNWVFDIGAGYTTTPISLRPDGTGTYLGNAATWQVLADGSLQILRQTNTVGRQTRYDWILLSKGSDGSILVLRRLVTLPRPNFPGTEESAIPWQVLRYRDAGPGS